MIAVLRCLTASSCRFTVGWATPPLDSSPIGLYEGFFGAQPRLCRTFVLERFRDDLTVVGVLAL